jgi:flagellar basal body rod protein FlgF
MLRALYTGASGMSAQEMNLENVANNLANSSTAGFRKRRGLDPADHDCSWPADRLGSAFRGFRDRAKPGRLQPDWKFA